MRTRKRAIWAIVLAFTICWQSSAALASNHETEPGSFFVQVTPSPLFKVVKPGQVTEVELKIRNAGTATERLRIEPRNFKYDDNSGDIVLDDQTLPVISSWINFSEPVFTVPAGQWFTQKVRFDVPAEAGFSHSFALMISRTAPAEAEGGSAALRGSVAVFSLINIDRPDAKRSMELEKLSTTKGIYEYLPAELTVRLKNTGNTIALPAGNVFFQRTAKDTEPLTTLPVNPNLGYLLPGTSRNFSVAWEDGFQVYRNVQNPDGTVKRQLVWRWGSLDKIRIGRYTAKVVAVYNDGVRDVPIEGEVSFWVIPWKVIGGFLLVALLMLFGVFSMVRGLLKLRPGRRSKR